jgi:hypothetical protein
VPIFQLSIFREKFFLPNYYNVTLRASEIFFFFKMFKVSLHFRLHSTFHFSKHIREHKIFHMFLNIFTFRHSYFRRFPFFRTPTNDFRAIFIIFNRSFFNSITRCSQNLKTLLDILKAFQRLWFRLFLHTIY